MLRNASARRDADPQFAYFVQLAAFHEQMHCEAFTYTRQTLGYPAPESAARIVAAATLAGDIAVAGGEFLLGASPGDGFVFDNEKWAHPVRIEPFAIARAQVSNAEFAAFVEDGGYRRRELWCEAGWRWRESAAAQAPVYWARSGGSWGQRGFERSEALAPHAAVTQPMPR